MVAGWGGQVQIQPQKQRSHLVALFWQAIQILIGLIHIGLGFVLFTILPGSYIVISFYGGFPFWGSIWVSNVSHSASELPESVDTLRATLSSCAVSHRSFPAKTVCRV